MRSGIGWSRSHLLGLLRGGRWSDHRRVINGVLNRVRTGVQWRDLPERFGPWKTVYKRHRRWSADGTWTKLLSRIQAAEDAAGQIDWDVSVDSTAVRARQHAAGARKTPAAADPQRGNVRGTNQVDPVLRKLAVRLLEVVRSASVWDVPAADSPPRFTSPPTGDAAPALVLTPGHYGDGPQLERVLEQVSVPRLGVGRPRTRPDHVLADKAHTSRKNRRYLRRRGIRHTIPERLDQRRHRRNRGS